jgi:hypothetical protein
MKYLFFAILYLGVAYRSKNISPQNSSIIRNNINLNGKIIGNKMKIKIGTEVFMATLYNNKTANTFKTKLPLTLTMNELNGNEKYVQLSTDLPTNTEEIGTIQEGDLMLWGANTLVVFYKTFKTSYRYTKLGHIVNPHRLASSLGTKNVIVSFETE